RRNMVDHHGRPVPMSLVLMLLASALSGVPRESAAQTTGQAAPDPLVFDTWVPGPCSPNGQPQGQCPPGDLFRVRLVAIAEGLKSPRHMAFTPDGRILIAELAGRVRLVRGGVLLPEPLMGWPVAG